jgi:hypothetical protein
MEAELLKPAVWLSIKAGRMLRTPSLPVSAFLFPDPCHLIPVPNSRPDLGLGCKLLGFKGRSEAFGIRANRTLSADFHNLARFCPSCTNLGIISANQPHFAANQACNLYHQQAS